MTRVLLLVLTLSIIAFSKDIAVMDFKSNDSLQDAAQVLSDKVSTVLFNQGIGLVERKEMSAILEEQKFQQSGCTETECAVQLGRILNVQDMVVGSLRYTSKRYYLTMRILNIESGRISSIVSRETKDIKDLSDKDLVHLTNKLMREKPNKILPATLADSNKVAEPELLYPELSDSTYHKGPPASKVIGAIFAGLVGTAVITFAIVDYSTPGDNPTINLQ